MATITIDFNQSDVQAWFDQEVIALLNILADQGAELVAANAPLETGFLAESVHALHVGSAGRAAYNQQRVRPDGQTVMRRAGAAPPPPPDSSSIVVQASYAGVRESLAGFLRTGIDRLDLDDAIRDDEDLRPV